MMSSVTRDRFQYLPISRRDREWDLYATGTGRVVDEVPDYDFSRHPEPYYCTWEKGRVLPEYAVLYITRGTGKFESETTGTKTITAGNAFLLFPGVWHRYRPLKESPWTEYWVTFGGGYPRRLLQPKFMSPKNPVLATGLDETILGVYRRLWDHVQSAEIDIQQMIAANTMEILASVFRAARVHQNRDQVRALVRQAKLILQQSIEQSVDIQELAASLGVSYHYFAPRLQATHRCCALSVSPSIADQPGQGDARGNIPFGEAGRHRTEVRRPLSLLQNFQETHWCFPNTVAGQWLRGRQLTIPIERKGQARLPTRCRVLCSMS
jgi:hypothetical protein